MSAVFSGFDSAWSAANSGAICDLALSEDGSLRFAADPVVANWDYALARASHEVDVDLHIWAVDQPLVVRNNESCRPVERGLASALMADFGCGAHSSNLSMLAWSERAPIWEFLRLLQSRNYLHDPMAIPGAASGRFYFECYPHPAILGLFKLGRILKYKVDHRSQDDWRTLVGLLRSLSSAELPIRNICSFVQDGLRKNKENEDKLDSVISAYVAAYWWRYGVNRSTVIGDLATGYMVTPHSERTLAALARVFGGRMNLRGAVSAPPPPVLPIERGGAAGEGSRTKPDLEIPEVSGALPSCDWVYFATTAKWSGTVTGKFVEEHKVIVRNLHNADGQLIANVRHLKPGERILLVHGGHGKPYHALFSCVICASGAPVRTSHHSFDVFSYIDKSLHESLRAGGYAPDPVVGGFTGISITAAQDLRGSTSEIPRPGRGTIWRWGDVFGR